MNRPTRRIIAPLVIALFVPAARAANQSADPFETITYHDSGGFVGGGTGKSLSVTADGKLDARTRDRRQTTIQLQPRELTDLNTAVANIDWPHIESSYRLPGGHDIVSRDLTVVIRGTTYETHADMMAKVPSGLRELFDRLDVLYRRAAGAQSR